MPPFNVTSDCGGDPVVGNPYEKVRDDGTVTHEYSVECPHCGDEATVTVIGETDEILNIMTGNGPCLSFS